MIRLLLVFLLFSFFTHNSSGQGASIPQVIDTADFVITKNQSPFRIDKSIVVSEGRKLTIEDDVIVNFVTSEKYFDVRGTMVVGKGVTFNMAKDTYIKTENSGKLEVNGTESDSVTFTGTNWDGIRANAQGSLIKYSKILNVGDDQCCDWFVKLTNRSTLENSRISNSRNGAYVSNRSKLLNSKIHNVRRHALEIHSNSTVTGNEIYDNNTSETSNYHVYVHNSTFNSNRIYQTSDTRNNYGVISQGGSTLKYNTIGGSVGKHGSVGISVRYDIDHTIMYNNIGGYASNVVIHGYKDNLQFTGNTFFGEMETSTGQRNVTIVNGQSDIDGYKQWGDSFNNGILSIKINLENNFWGNTSDIPSTIKDYTDEIERKGIVDYDPSLSAASSQAPISIPGGVTKALSGSDVILSWDAVTASDLAGYKVYSKVGEVHTLVKDVTDKDSTTYTVVGGDINTRYVVTSYDTDADGVNDQLDGTESWYSSEFSALSFSLSVQSDNAISTVGGASTYDKWLIAGYDGDSATYSMSYDRADDWNFSDGSNARGRFEYQCTVNCNTSERGLVVNYNNWGGHGLVEVNELVTTLSTSKSSGSYNYLGQYNGHSYFRTSWSNYSWSEHRDQANLDGAYLLVINDDNEAAYLSAVGAEGWVGYYSEKEGSGYTMPGVWKWVEERDPDTGFDLRLPESAVNATLTATLDRKYTKEVSITLTTSGSATITDDYTLSAQSITIPAGSISGTSTLTVVEDNTDEDDRDTVKIEVSASTYAVETVDQKIFIAIEDDDQMPGVTLTASKDTISENGGTSDLTATLSTASGRDVSVGLVMQGTAGSSDFTAGGNTIDVSETLTDSLVANYTFSGNADDGTSNDNDGNVSGATLTSDRFGEANSAYQFDGVNDYISVPLSSSLQIKEDITISVWVNKESSDNWTDFVVRAPGEYYEMRIDQRDNNTAFEAYGRGAASWDHVGSGNHIDNGEWVMLTFTSTSETDTSGFTTRKEFKFYVNGELRNTDSRIGNRFEMNTSQELMIGSNQNGDNNNFKGKMDELRIYKKALSDADINTLYSNSSIQKINATISIPKGQTTGKLEIKGVDDQTDETEETIVSKIVSTTGASETGDQSATIIISDDDSTTVSLSVTSSTVTEGADDYASVKVSIDKASELPVTVKLKFSGVDSTDFVLKKEATLVTGENVTWLPPSWGSGEPNNSGGTEDYAHLTSNSTQYNDLNENNSRRFLIEFPYLTSDAISGFEYKGQYNGHSYYRSNQDNQSGWNGAKASADAIEGAYLLVISTEAELSFVAANVSRDNDWIGFYQDRSSPDYSEPLGGWTWVGSVFNPEISEVVIPAGSTEVTVYVFAEDDEVMGEANETMKLSIDQTTNGVAGTSKEVDITIVDNDIKPDASLAIGTASVKEGDGKYSKVTATLSVATTQPVKVNLTLSGTASSGDYEETPDTVQATTNGLVAYYDFDGDANDESGNSNNGTANNATLTTDRHGNANKAYSFNGNNSYVEVPWNGSVRVQDDITMSAWINIKDKSDDGNYYGSYGRIIRAPNEYYEMNLNWNGGDGTNNRDIYARSGGHGYQVGTQVSEGEWKNVIYTYTSDTLRIYVDGVLSAKEYRSWTWNNSLPSSGSLYIGANSPNNNTFLGSIDDVRIYNRALTTSEVSTLYSVENAAPVSSSITVPTGQTSSSIYLSAVDDDVYEGTETAKLSISSVDNGQAASSGTSVELSIEDNDGVPSVTLTSNKDFIGESEDFKLAVLTATSTSAAGDTIKVVISTSGTGTKDTDYELSSDTIFILPGSLTGTINVTAKWLAQNEPTEGEENVTLAIASVIGATEDGTQSVTLKITETSCDAVDKELKGNIKDMTLFELCSPYTVGGSGFKVKDGFTLTLEENAVLNFTDEGQKIVVDGKLIIKEGATINMSKYSYIVVEDDGQLVIEGTETNRVTITGSDWGKYTNNSGWGYGLDLNSSVASTIKYADIINDNDNSSEWMIAVRDGSIIENSSISGGREGVYLEDGTIKDSKIHSFRRKALSLYNSSTATGNEIYNSQTESNNQPYVQVYTSSTFKNNRIYSTSNTTKNWALYVEGNSTVENNTIGGSTGQHGAVGIAIRYDNNATIRYNNIGGYQANVAVHGHGSGNQSYTFSNNSFVGNLSGNQRHVVVYDGNNKTDWHTTNIPNYDENGQAVDTERINFENNYWGTTTTSVIDASIQDTDDDETFDVNGFIDYTPYSTSASTSAPIPSPFRTY
ncbi:MAG: LamG-like jellyroll fold domain-containing protein [Cytophagales bacterium]